MSKKKPVARHVVGALLSHDENGKVCPLGADAVFEELLACATGFFGGEVSVGNAQVVLTVTEPRPTNDGPWTRKACFLCAVSDAEGAAEMVRRLQALPGLSSCLRDMSWRLGRYEAAIASVESAISLRNLL